MDVERANSGMIRDPVCGMVVETDDSTAVNLPSHSSDWISTPRSAEPGKTYSGNGGNELG